MGVAGVKTGLHGLRRSDKLVEVGYGPGVAVVELAVLWSTFEFDGLFS